MAKEIDIIDKFNKLRDKYYTESILSSFDLGFVRVLVHVAAYELEDLGKKRSDFLTDRELGIFIGLREITSSGFWGLSEAEFLEVEYIHQLFQDNIDSIKARVQNVLQVMERVKA